MHNAKRTRPGSQYNAANQAATIDPNHYPFIKFPADSPVQPGDRVEWMDEDDHLLTGSVLEEGAYLLQNVLYVRVDFDECIDAVAAASLTKVFDYEALDAETRIVVQQKTGEIKTLMRRTAQDIIDIGERLIEVKAKLGHGGFGKWLDAEFSWTDRMAQKFINVANAFKSENFSDLKFGPSALYLLAAPSTPEEARAEAIQRAEAGEVVTHAVAKAIVTALRPPVTPAPEPSPTAKAYQQANQVLPPVTRPPAATYGKREDDYQDDVPSVDADEPDWLDHALAGDEAVGFAIGDIVNDSAGHKKGEIIELSPQMGALVKFPFHTPWWLSLHALTKVEPEADEDDEDDDEPAAEPIVFMVGDKVQTYLGRTGGVVQAVEEGRVGVRFPEGAYWSESATFRLVERPVVKSKTEPAAPYAHHLSGSNEWYTPMQYVNAVRELLVGITLDPASCAYANQIVRAAHYYDIGIDGLTQEWKGSVFLNPPYGKDENNESNVGIWTAKLLAEYKAKRVSEAVLLVNANTECKWFQPLWQFPICFTDHRINFYNADGEQKQPTQGNAFVYFGEHIHTFANIFAQFGTIVRKV